MQAKLLRFLQFREIQRVGADSTTSVDVRVVSATHRDLAGLVNEKTFRQDLYFRLRVVELVVPPLRERRDDILLLADTFLRRKWRRPDETPRLTPAAERVLLGRGFPGNVRELEHLMERVALLAAGPVIDADLLDAEALDTPAASPGAPRFTRLDAAELDEARASAVASVERAFVAALLAHHDGNVSKAARESGVNRTYLQRLLARTR